DVVLPEIDADRFEAAEILIDHAVGRRLEDYLKLLVLVEAIRVLAVAAVGGPAAGLHVRDAIRLRPEHAQEGLRRHGAGAYFDVVRLGNDAAAVRPVAFQTEDGVLERRLDDRCAGHTHSDSSSG